MPASYTSELAQSLAPDLLERFTRYVRFDTQSAVDREQCPSTPGQLELSRTLIGELLELGLEDAELDQSGYVYATLSSNTAGAPAIGLIAHVDTSPEAPGAGVEPIVHRDYDGSVIELPKAGVRLDPEQMPELGEKLGHDIVTASGDTLLGADDKAGIASIMAATRYLVEHPSEPRPTLRICFTPDEEIGEGATLFDIERFGTRCAYTIDGSALGELQDESFTAIEVRIGIDGVNVHPGQAYGKMVSALRIASQLIAALPQDHLTPATTKDREGFIHPIELRAAPDHADIKLIVRDFEEDLLDAHVAVLRDVAERTVGAYPKAKLEFTVKRWYRNMRDYIAHDPEVMEAALAALAAEGIEPIRSPIRGGTDGSRLSERGLPTPNLFDGGYEYHSVREWASLQEMAASAATIVRLASVWAGRGAKQ